MSNSYQVQAQTTLSSGNHSLFIKPSDLGDNRLSSNAAQDTKSATKRLFSNTNLPVHDLDHNIYRRSTSQSYVDENETTDLGSQSEKRHRTSDWPLKGTAVNLDKYSRPALVNRSQGIVNTTLSRSRDSSRPRPSKFLEGSMNDRVSQQPHLSYIGTEDEARMRFEDEQGIKGERKWHLDESRPHDDQPVALTSLASKSVLFRFGKSLSTAFNPSNWNFWSKPQHEDESAQGLTLRDRRENAEKIYQDMKQKGLIKQSSYDPLPQHKDGFAGVSKHDSGVGFVQHIPAENTLRGTPYSNMPSNKKGSGGVYQNKPIMADAGRHQSPLSDTQSSPSKKSFYFRKPSLPDVRMGPRIPQQPGISDCNATGMASLRHLPSRKDLQKQQKLVKRVSDLEGRLEAARRQLSKVISEPVPKVPTVDGLSRFHPGALASLPSERLLSAFTSISEATLNAIPNAEIGQAVSMDDRPNTIRVRKSAAAEIAQDQSSGLLLDKLVLPPITPSIEKPASGVDACKNVESEEDMKLEGVSTSETKPTVTKRGDNVGAIQVSSRKSSKKRKSIGLGMADDGGNYYPAAAESDDNDDEEVRSGFPKQPSVPKRKSNRPRKLQKVEFQPTHAGRFDEGPANIDNRTIQDDTESKRQITSHHIPRKAPFIKNPGYSSKKGYWSVSPPPPPLLPVGATTLKVDASPSKIALQDDDDEESLPAPPSRDAPPVPKVPNVVRLPSGEVYNISRAAVPSIPCESDFKSHSEIDPDGQLVTTKSGCFKSKEKMERRSSERSESFEWPADVF